MHYYVPLEWHSFHFVLSVGPSLVERVRNGHQPIGFRTGGMCFDGHHVQSSTKDGNRFTSWLVWLVSVVSWLVVRFGLFGFVL